MTFQQFSFGQGDDFIFALDREEEALFDSLYLPEKGLWNHKLLWFLEGQMTQDLSEAPHAIRRLMEIHEDTCFGEHGELVRYPQGAAEYGGVWFILCAGQGPLLLGCTAKDDDEIKALMAQRPWEQLPDQERAGVEAFGFEGWQGLPG